MQVHDEVCGMTIDRQTATVSFEFEGRRYYFCSQRCKRLFAEHPDWYVAVGTGEGSTGSKG